MILREALSPRGRDERSARFEYLPPAPRFCGSAQLTDRGVVLGEGVVVAPLTRSLGATVLLAVEGREGEIFALLSLAKGAAIHPNVVHGLHGVAKSLARGEIVGAMIRLAQIGLPQLRGPRDVELLNVGARFLAKGLSPWTILQAAGIADANVQLAKAEWDEALHPRDSATGRFVSTGGATVVAASAAQSLIAGGAMQVAAGVYALAGGALLSLTAAGWVLSHGPKGDIQDGASYWLPGVASESTPDDGGRPEAPGLGHNGGPALDQSSDQQPQDPNGRDPDQKPQPSVVASISADVTSNDQHQQGGADTTVISNTLPTNSSQLSHIFRGDAGHLLDTPENRRELSNLVNDSQNLLGADRYGSLWYAQTLPDGTQLWGTVRNGIIQNGGLNTTPRSYNQVTGLSGSK